ncbi:hypothetical protein KSP39_PZI006647 [Platanthera zijinensis]|uniref:Uncharacterized protein n=1 Tax=Platanthera zijinensis TaxID=2320716 RepID=A0AAP0BQP7_9ASPA
MASYEPVFLICVCRRHEQIPGISSFFIVTSPSHFRGLLDPTHQYYYSNEPINYPARDDLNLAYKTKIAGIKTQAAKGGRAELRRGTISHPSPSLSCLFL